MKKIIFCSRKIFYDIKEKMKNEQNSHIVLIRVEQLFPFPEEIILKSIKNYIKAKFYWCQEEPKNMGAWTFVSPLINKILEKKNFLNKKCFYAGRKEAASTATGLYKRHIIEQEEFINYVLND